MADEVNMNAAGGASDPSTERPVSSGVWGIAILIAGLAAWGIYNYPPKTWRVPEEMSHIGALSSKEDQAKLAAVERSNLWKNTLLKFTLAGMGVGLAGLVVGALSRSTGASIGASTPVVGAIAGAAGGAITLVCKQWLDLEHPIPMISPETRPLFCDTVVFALISTFLLLPLTFLLAVQPAKADRAKAMSAPLAGLLTGMLVPFTAGLILPADVSTSIYPPHDIRLTTLWVVTLTLMAVLMILMAGHKKTTTATTA